MTIYKSVRCGESFPIRLPDIVRKFTDCVLTTEANPLSIIKSETPLNAGVSNTAFVKESGYKTHTR